MCVGEKKTMKADVKNKISLVAFQNVAIGEIRRRPKFLHSVCPSFLEVKNPREKMASQNKKWKLHCWLTYKALESPNDVYKQ